ncbi:MAG: hypothetical protein Ta2A_25970 [Treponemataceae bacterium]|nr:MAG: hypothetical protein Ta2A_25970 [Treponemataceae bacterium]
MLERIAAALEIDSPELFTIPPSPEGSLQKLHRAVLNDIEQAVGVAAVQSIKDAVGQVVDKYRMELDNSDSAPVHGEKQVNRENSAVIKELACLKAWNNTFTAILLNKDCITNEQSDRLQRALLA